jgi:prolyl-tRNA synthetase
MRKEDDFSEWYAEVVDKAGMRDKRYPIKGMDVWTAYGWKAMSLVDALMREEMARTGHEEVCFPLLIPETEFRKESEHIKGFEGEVYWVTHAGKNELDVPLLLRPTSESAMYPIFALWVRSHADLPLKTFQIVNTFRYDTKVTRTLMRMREIHFFEAHTCHRTFEDAERQIMEDLEVMANLARELALAVLVTKRPDWDKFPGAHYSLAADALMPTGRTLQLGTMHQYRDNFAVAYGIKYEEPSGEHQYVHQTTYGMSERLLGAVVAVHGDDTGVVLPPAIAPVQVVVVPILEKGKKEEVGRAAEEVHGAIRGSIRSRLDDREIRPGAKFYEWERKGVPLRVEVGPREAAGEEVTAVRRDTGEKIAVRKDRLLEGLREILDAIQSDLLAKSERELREGITIASDYSEAGRAITRFGWCGKEECGHNVEDATGLSILGTPYPDEAIAGTCVSCGSSTDVAVYAARTY